VRRSPRHRVGPAHGAARSPRFMVAAWHGRQSQPARRCRADADAAAPWQAPTGIGNAGMTHRRGSAGPGRHADDGTPARVLVIEDDDDLRDTLLRYLRGVGMLARGLESAEEARRGTGATGFRCRGVRCQPAGRRRIQRAGPSAIAQCHAHRDADRARHGERPAAWPWPRRRLLPGQAGEPARARDGAAQPAAAQPGSAGARHARARCPCSRGTTPRRRLGAITAPPGCCCRRPASACRCPARKRGSFSA
jgi:hypothetical protein